MRERLAATRDRVRVGIARAFAEEHTPREIAASFAFGVFVAALPTGGVGLVLFVLLAALVDRVSKVGLVAAVVVFNPPVKWSVYAASFWLGSRLLGPIPGLSFSDVSVSELSLSAGTDVVARQLLGNVVLAVVFAVLGYVVALRIARAYHRHDLDPAELLPDRSSE